MVGTPCLHTMTSNDEHLVVNTIGHLAGSFVFGHFLVLTVWNRPISQLRASRLSIIAASLAFLWNLCSVAALAMDPNPASAVAAISGFGFCALSLLPAILLHLCLPATHGWLIRSGYAVSAVSVVSHLIEIIRDRPVYHQVGLVVVTAGFGVLTVASVVVVLWSGRERSRGLGSRLLAVMSLFLFAISFVHFGQETGSGAWSAELVVHHAGIPLALFILLQDYRFILMDAFIRLLANGLLAVSFAVAITYFLDQLSFTVRIAASATMLVVFANIRHTLQQWLGRLVFRQGDAATATREMQDLANVAIDEESFLQLAIERLTSFANAPAIDWPASRAPMHPALLAPVATTELADVKAFQRAGVHAIVPIRLAHGSVRHVYLGERQGGRRYLSEDLEQLSLLAAFIAEQVEVIREKEMRRLLSQAELLALQSQINPHFLFNALNTIYGIIPREVTGARRMLLHLADIFRYILQADKNLITLGDELRIVKAYLAIEELRLGERLRYSIDVDREAERASIPILSLQPLVENAVKHGIAEKPEGGEVRIVARYSAGGVSVEVRDTGVGFGQSTRQEAAEHAGVGMDNVSRRLELCYGAASRLEVQSGPEGTSVGFFAPAQKHLVPVR